MSSRELIAYGLIAAMAIVIACWIVWLRYNSRERKLSRQRSRDEARYDERRADKEAAARDAAA